MDFEKAFSYQFADKDKWKKLLLNGLLCIIPIFGHLYGLGWSLNIMKRVQDDHPAPLPDGFDIGGNLILGLKGYIVGIVYSIPLIIFYLPFAIIPAIMIFVDPDIAEILFSVVTLFSLCCIGPAIILSLGIALLTPAAYGRLNINGSIRDALQFGEVFNQVKSNIGAFLLAVLGTFAARIIRELGDIACGVGLIFTIPYALTIMAHLYAQAYKVESISTV